MSTPAINARATIIPALRYRDPATAVDWLCKAFGFERHAVAVDKDGKVQHAELAFGNGMIMLGPSSENAYGKLMRQPGEAGGETQAPYVIVADADAHCARAEAAGAEILLALEDEDYGGRGYTCRDPEGHVWSFGTYNPWLRASRE